MIGDDADDGVALIKLSDAMGRLHTFAVSHGQANVIDDASGLTTEDLDLLLDVLEKIKAIALAAPKLR